MADVHQGSVTAVDVIQWIGHALGLGVIAGTILGFLPALAAAIAIFWYVIQIAESKTLRDFLARRRTRKILRLQQKLRRMQAPDVR